MKPRVRSALLLVATVVVGGVVRADAPSGQYLTFRRSDVCISDAFTKLTWIRAPLPVAQTFNGATAQCLNLGTGWRVPSVNELETLVDENPHQELENGVLTAKAIDANAFPGTPVGTPYWTSSVALGTDGWAVDFHDGSTLTWPQGQSLAVRCVIVSSATVTPTACQ